MRNDYIDMKESYIVFICLFDPLGKNLPVYTIEQKISENNEIYNDKTHKVVYTAHCASAVSMKISVRKTREACYNVNAFESSDNENVKAFLRYIKTHEASDTFTEMLERRVAQIKHEENYRKDYMTYQMHLMELAREARKEGIAIGEERGISQGIAQGEHKKAVETARNFLSLGIVTVEQIAQATGLPLEEVQRLRTTATH